MKNHLESSKTYRYFTHGDIEKANKLLFVLHGYGQLAEFFIRKFHFLEEDYFIVAPEGMHRFYLKGSSGRVGASWMTKEDRDSDIKDNIHYLNSLYDSICSSKKFDQITLLGFSQGGATAARWFNSFQRNIDAHISWASIYPPDLDITPCEKNKNNYFAIGDKDEYFSEHKLKETILFYKNLNYITFTFHGKHNIDPLTLKEILNQININK
jgi:predicted esterase